MTFFLKFTSLPKDGLGQYHANHAPAYYFLYLGQQWPDDPSKRLIDATTPDIREAKPFDTVEDARTTLVQAGRPPGWEVIDELGNVLPAPVGS